MNTRLTRSLLVLVVAGGMLAGCESMRSVRESVHDRFVGMPPKVRVVQGDSRQVFTAARLAMAKLGFEMVRGGPAQAELEGLTRVGSGDDFRSSRQREITIHLESVDNGGVEVRVLLKEITEDQFSKVSIPATETPVRDPAVYDAFFDELERQLQGVAGK